MLLLATVGVGLIKVVFIGVAACLVEHVGRVRLLLVSTAGIGLAQCLLGLSFSLGRIVWLALAGQVSLFTHQACAAALDRGDLPSLQGLFMAAFSIGAGPCSMMVASELFPLQVRRHALARAHVHRPTVLLLACFRTLTFRNFILNLHTLRCEALRWVSPQWSIGRRRGSLQPPSSLSRVCSPLPGRTTCLPALQPVLTSSSGSVCRRLRGDLSRILSGK